MKGDAESSTYRRKEHKKRMNLASKPNPRMLAILGEDEAELVKSDSTKWKHKEMFNRALAFKREFGYDFVQWKSRKGDDDPFVHGYIFTSDEGSIVGACSFLYRRSKEGMLWVLDWVWVCPSYRRLGVLAKRWKKFRLRFGEFGIESPVSDE